MKMTPQQYCLRWKHHHSNVQNMFAQLLEKERFCDVTLYCSPNFSTQVPNKDTVQPDNIKGVSLRAHRVVLAACSELLGALLGAHDSLGEPVLVIDGAEPRHLRALLDYMYTGEMSVHHSQLASLLKTAEELRIKGLTDIRWNNKDEPPDGQAGGVITTSSGKRSPERKTLDRKSASPKPKLERMERVEQKENSSSELLNLQEKLSSELRTLIKREDDERHDKFSVNGGPPPLIKLPPKDKSSPIKRELSDTDTQSPKRQRLGSGAENSDDDYQLFKTETDEWQHGNMDISAERVVGWGSVTSPRRSDSEDEWGDAPADIGCFLHTRLRVPGDNSADEESNDSGPARTSLPTSTVASTSSTPPAAGISPQDIKVDLLHAPMLAKPACKSSGPVDPRFADVVKLNDYLQHGRRPQFWEENYVRRVMEAVRLKELEMKQAAEILGVSYGTLYGRYRDVYGCINRPYNRTARDFWQAKGPSEVVERLQKGELSLDAASQALGVAPANLAAYVVTDVVPEKSTNFEPIPIEIDPSLKMKPTRSVYPVPGHTGHTPPPKTRFRNAPAPASPADKAGRKVVVGSVEDEDIPAAVITTSAATASGKWPSLRVAQLDTLRDPPAVAPPAAPASPADPSHLMRTRPDLTIVAAKREKDGHTPPT